ncbi:exosome complex protein Rrp4 [Candidatus Woesearchaeota archaeon]|nr:exosome complex protein Rrp4 [Candidatus Woesearchaeota archaeon]
MGELLVKDKEVVVPGQILAKGLDFLPSNGTYRLSEDILANRLGVISVEGKVLRSIPMAGRYLPQRNDVIIGKVDDILMSGWRLDINCPYSAVLPLKDASFDFIAKGADLTRYFNLEDFVMVKITNVTSQNLIDVTAKGPGLKKLRGGRVMKVNPNKVPRIIGKKGSMVSMIKKGTDCKIMIGQNGLIWFEGTPDMEVIVSETIKKIEKESHHQGMTDKIKVFLEQRTGRIIDLSEQDESEHNNQGDQQ